MTIGGTDMAKLTRVAPYADDEMNLPVRDVDEAIPFYERVMGFAVESREEEPCRKAVLARDGLRMAIAENGGDPEQEGQRRPHAEAAQRVPASRVRPQPGEGGHAPHGGGPVVLADRLQPGRHGKDALAADQRLELPPERPQRGQVHQRQPAHEQAAHTRPSWGGAVHGAVVSTTPGIQPATSAREVA